MKYLILPFLIACGSPMVQVYGPGHTTMAQILKDRAVALVVKDSEDGSVQAYCSGVWVSNTEILTANHCVIGVDYINYVVNSDVYDSHEPTLPKLNITPRFAVITKRDIDHDLAILTAPNKLIHGNASVGDDVVQGQSVQTMGQPKGLWFSYSSGEVAAIRVMPSAHGYEMLLIQSTAFISPGSSGGGLFDEYGNVVGITHAAYQGGGAENLNLFIHTKYIRKILGR